jgi:hypothetical protein
LEEGLLSLIGEVKRRRLKQASLGQLGARTLAELGEEAAERAAIVYGGDRPARVPAMQIRQVAEARVSDLVADMVKRKRLPANQASALSKKLLADAEPAIRAQESAAYRTETGERAMAPSTLTGTAGAIGGMTGMQWLMDRGSHMLSSPAPGKLKAPAPTLGQAFKSVFLPSFLPVAAALEFGLGHALSPIGDPQYRGGQRGYWQSVGESYRGAKENLAEQGAQARARYGPFGIPLQMFHGMMNPLASLGYLGQQVGDMFKKPDIKRWAQEAAERRKAEYGQS